MTIVDSYPAWPRQAIRPVQIDTPALLSRTLEEFQERCRLIAEWQASGFMRREPELKYFARRLAAV
jgi:hypothetical protein